MLAQNQEESQIVVRWQTQGNKGSTNSAEKVKQEQCCSTKLNQELNAQDTDWMELHLQLKHSGISLKH